jgi:hypothetical protein
MSRESNMKAWDELIEKMLDVQRLQRWLILTAGHIRISVASGDTDASLLPMAEYLEKQGGNLNQFIRDLDNPPNLDAGQQPVVNTKPTFDPKAN